MCVCVFFLLRFRRSPTDCDFFRCLFSILYCVWIYASTLLIRHRYKQKFIIFAIKMFVSFARKVHLYVCIRQVDNVELTRERKNVMGQREVRGTDQTCTHSKCWTVESFLSEKTALVWEVSVSARFLRPWTRTHTLALILTIPIWLPFAMNFIHVSQLKVGAPGWTHAKWDPFEWVMDGREKLWRAYQLLLLAKKTLNYRHCHHHLQSGNIHSQSKYRTQNENIVVVVVGSFFSLRLSPTEIWVSPHTFGGGGDMDMGACTLNSTDNI